MKSKKDLVVAVLATFCLAAILFTILPVSSLGAWPYDPWWDLNEDGKIDIADVARISGAYGTLGDPTKNVTVTNWPDWLVNQSALLIKEMPLLKLYEFNITSTSYAIGINATPPIGKTWFVSEIRLKSNGGDGYLRLETKGVIQFDIQQAYVNWLDTAKFPAIMKFTDTESIILEGKAAFGYTSVNGYLCLIGWEE